MNNFHFLAVQQIHDLLYRRCQLGCVRLPDLLQSAQWLIVILCRY